MRYLKRVVANQKVCGTPGWLVPQILLFYKVGRVFISYAPCEMKYLYNLSMFR